MNATYLRGDLIICKIDNHKLLYKAICSTLYVGKIDL